VKDAELRILAEKVLRHGGGEGNWETGATLVQGMYHDHMDYVGACSPQTIIDLLNRLEKAKMVVEVAREGLETDFSWDPDELPSEVEALTKALQEYDKEK
jgi:hypothetical protein